MLPLSYEDAAPLLRSLGGPEAPAGFRGALNLTYRLGPTARGIKARLMVNNTFSRTPVWNVIAKIPGTLPAEQDQPVFLGNHRDAWVYGAADPNSGTAQLLEVAKGLGMLLKGGWRPRRSIVLASWSGEEYGLLGSTAWSEVNAKTALLRRAVAYLNVDTGVSGRTFRAQGTPSLGRVLAGVLGSVADPARPGHSLAEAWGDGDLFALGSGSDYVSGHHSNRGPTTDLQVGSSADPVLAARPVRRPSSTTSASRASTWHSGRARPTASITRTLTRSSGWIALAIRGSSSMSPWRRYGAWWHFGSRAPPPPTCCPRRSRSISRSPPCFRRSPYLTPNGRISHGVLCLGWQPRHTRLPGGVAGGCLAVAAPTPTHCRSCGKVHPATGCAPSPRY